MTLPILDKLILCSQPELTLGCCGSTILCTIYLPTEVVVTSPQIVVPKTARVYRTPWYIFENLVVVHEDQMSEIHAEFHDPSSYVPVLLIEVWGSVGDDGHTVYEQLGWRFVNGAAFEAVKTTAEWHGRSDLLAFIGRREED